MKTIIGENYYAGILDDLIINQDDNDVFEKLEVFLKKIKIKPSCFLFLMILKTKLKSSTLEMMIKSNFL